MIQLREGETVMNKFRDWMRRFGSGRYGTDQYNRFLMLITLILMVVAIFVRSWVLEGIILALLIYGMYRTLSRNTVQRAEENRKYLEIMGRIRGFFTGGMRQARDRDHLYFRCPNCGQKVRVPRNHGHIEITCPKCRTRFVKDTGAKRA